MIRLNIACGANMFPGWLNLDRVDMNEAYLDHLRRAPSFDGWPPAQQKLGFAVKEGLVEFRQQDLRKGFPEFADGTVDAIYCGQMIEHLNRRTEALPFLRECFRMLRSGGRIRLTTPDLAQIIHEYRMGSLAQFAPEQPAFFATASKTEQLAYLMFGASGDDCTRENYEGHFHLYAHDSLADLLGEAGLRYGVFEGLPSPFADTIDCGMSHSFAIEGVKP